MYYLTKVGDTYFIILLHYMASLYDIVSELKLDGSGTLIVDNLARVGNGNNRFMKMQYTSNHVVISTTVPFVDTDNVYNKVTCEFLRTLGAKYMDNFVIGKDQVDFIKLGGNI